MLLTTSSNFSLVGTAEAGANMANQILNNITASNTPRLERFDDAFVNLVQVFIFVIAVASVIGIIVGGIKYITAAGGDSAESGKKTLIYATIGIAVTVLAEIYVLFLAQESRDLMSLNLVGTAHAAFPTLNEILGGQSVYTGTNDLEQVVSRFDPASIFIRNFIMYTLAAGFVSVLYGGFLYATANGDQSKAAKGKMVLIVTAIGVFILVGGSAIIGLITRIFTDAFN